MKKRMFILVMMMCFMIMGISVFAGNQEFNITVSREAGGHPDPLSFRQIKDDNEQKYYVTCTWMDHTPATFTFQSCSIDGNVNSAWGSYRSEDLNKTKSYWYGDSFAPGGKYYYLKGLDGGRPGAVYTYLNIIGIYCS